MENSENRVEPDDKRDAEASSEAYWEAVDRAFDLYHDEPEYGEHVTRIVQLFGPRRPCSFEAKENSMGMIKNYVLNLLQQCSEEQFGQDAIEWAIVSGFVTLSYDVEGDVRKIMSNYDEIIDAYRKARLPDVAAQTVKSPLATRKGPRRARVANDQSKVTARRKQSAA